MSKPPQRILNPTNPTHFRSGNGNLKNSEITMRKGMQRPFSLSILDLGSFKRDRPASFWLVQLVNLTLQSNGTKDQRSLNKTSSPSLTPMVSSPSRLSMHNLETLENTNAQPLINWERTPQTAQLLWRAHNIAVALLSLHLQMPHMLMAFQMVIKPCKCPCNQFNDDEK